MNSKKIATYIFKSIIALLLFTLVSFLFFILFNFLFGTYKNFLKFDLFIASARKTPLKYIGYYVLAEFIIFFGSFIFIFYKDILKLFKRIKGLVKGEEKDSAWLWNCATGEGSISAYNKAFKKIINENTEANWVFTHNKKATKFYVNDKDENAIVNGPPGSGKTQRILIPNILFNASLTDKHKANFFIPDPKKEIVHFVGETLKNNGYDIYVIDFIDPELSLAWNPLSRAYDVLHKKKKITMDTINTAFEIIQTVIDGLNWAKDEKNGMWIANAKKVLVAITQFLLLLSLHKDTKGNPFITRDQFNLETVSLMANQTNFAMKDNQYPIWIKYAEIHAKDDYYWNKVFSELVAFVKMPQETVGGFFANSNSAIAVFNNDEKLKSIIRGTEEFDLAKIVHQERPYAIFVHYPDHKTQNLFLVSMLIDQLYQFLIDESYKYESLKTPRKNLFILEECGNLPNINNFLNKLSIGRSRNIYFMLVLQSYRQLKKYNNEMAENDKALIEQCQVSFFLSSKDDETLNTISKSLGNKEVISKSYTSSSGGNRSTSESTKDKLVMDISQLKAKKPEHLLVSKPSYKPFMVKTHLAYKVFGSDKFIYSKTENMGLINNLYKPFTINEFERQIFEVQKELNENNENEQDDQEQQEEIRVFSDENLDESIDRYEQVQHSLEIIQNNMMNNFALKKELKDTQQNDELENEISEILDDEIRMMNKSLNKELIKSWFNTRDKLKAISDVNSREAILVEISQIKEQLVKEYKEKNLREQLLKFLKKYLEEHNVKTFDLSIVEMIETYKKIKKEEKQWM